MWPYANKENMQLMSTLCDVFYIRSAVGKKMEDLSSATQYFDYMQENDLLWQYIRKIHSTFTPKSPTLWNFLGLSMWTFYTHQYIIYEKKM